MNNYQYEELQGCIKSIPKFKELVRMESKRPIAVRLLVHLTGINNSTAWDFVTEYYNRTDINIFQQK